MKKCDRHGFTLIEAIIALAIASIIMLAIAGAALVVNLTIMPAGFATLSTGEILHAAPSPTSDASARLVQTVVAQMTQQSQWVFAANMAPADDWQMVTDPWSVLVNNKLSTADLFDPAAAASILSANGVPASLHPGRAVFFVKADYRLAGVLSYTEEVDGTWAVHRVKVRTVSSIPTASYDFAENLAYSQDPMTITVTGNDASVVPYLEVTLPDPALTYSFSAQRLASMGGDISTLQNNKKSAVRFVLPCVN